MNGFGCQATVEAVDIATWMKYKHLGKPKKGLIEEMAESGVENVDDLKTMADTRGDLLELFPGAVDDAYSKKLWEKLVLACGYTRNPLVIVILVF